MRLLPRADDKLLLCLLHPSHASHRHTVVPSAPQQVVGLMKTGWAGSSGRAL